MNFNEYLNELYDTWSLHLQDFPKDEETGSIDFNQCSKEQLIFYIQFFDLHHQATEALAETFTPDYGVIKITEDEFIFETEDLNIIVGGQEENE